MGFPQEADSEVETSMQDIHEECSCISPVEGQEGKKTGLGKYEDGCEEVSTKAPVTLQRILNPEWPLGAVPFE